MLRIRYTAHLISIENYDVIRLFLGDTAVMTSETPGNSRKVTGGNRPFKNVQKLFVSIRFVDTLN